MLKLPKVKKKKKSENLLALPRSFKYCKKLNPKIQMVKLSKDNKIKNQKIQNLQIIKTKQNKNIVIIVRKFQ